ncbi:hypothetical protein KFL_000710310 [Klebsormidium nitens]|uniref:Fungal lipase-type domain-containing protein n=1 Tax=Klebsormidium nitens TaxID=105231 RepID=A0A1Y1HX84_KLENI|nr:hypothetical protein KFL_000710310 [Klebsormidium nitens]|eukprot:GAQ81126.1 hypothetical protein KFL_000710310 [Klebsormidium nitens]
MAAVGRGVSACFHGNLKTANFMVRAQVELELCDRVYSMESDLGQEISVKVEDSERTIAAKLLALKPGIDIKDQLVAGSSVRLADRVAYAMWLVDDAAYGPHPTLICTFKGTATLEDWLSNLLFHTDKAGADALDTFLKECLKRTALVLDDVRKGTEYRSLQVHAGINLEMGTGLWDLLEETLNMEAKNHHSRKLALVLAGHSRGGGHATALFAQAVLRGKAAMFAGGGLTTFGGVRVIGTREGVQVVEDAIRGHDIRINNFVNGWDIVPRLFGKRSLCALASALAPLANEPQPETAALSLVASGNLLWSFFRSKSAASEDTGDNKQIVPGPSSTTALLTRLNDLTARVGRVGTSYQVLGQIHYLVLDDIITSRDGDAPPFAWQHILHLSKGVPNPVLDHTLVAYRTSLGRLRSGSVKVFVAKSSLDNGILQRLASAAPGIEAPKPLEDLSIQSPTDLVQSVVYAGKNVLFSDQDLTAELEGAASRTVVSGAEAHRLAEVALKGFLSSGSGLLLQAAASVYTISMCHVIDSTLKSHVGDMREATANIRSQLSELRTSVTSLSEALQSGLESIRVTVKEEFQKSHQFALLTKLELLQMNLTDFLEADVRSRCSAAERCRSFADEIFAHLKASLKVYKEHLNGWDRVRHYELMAFALLAHKWVEPRAESRARVESQVAEVLDLVSAEAASILAHPPMRLLVAHQDSVERLQSLLHIKAALTGETGGTGTGEMLPRAPAFEHFRAPRFIEDGLTDVRRLVWLEIEAGSTRLVSPDTCHVADSQIERLQNSGVFYPRRLTVLTLGGDERLLDSMTEDQLTSSQRYVAGPGIEATRRFLETQWPRQTALQSWGPNTWGEAGSSKTVYATLRTPFSESLDQAAAKEWAEQVGQHAGDALRDYEQWLPWILAVTQIIKEKTAELDAKGNLTDGVLKFLDQIRRQALQKDDLETSNTAWRFLFQFCASLDTSAGSWAFVARIAETLLEPKMFETEDARSASALLRKLCEWPEGRKILGARLCPILLRALETSPDGVTRTLAATTLLELILDEAVDLPPYDACHPVLFSSPRGTLAGGEPAYQMQAPPVLAQLLAALHKGTGSDLVPSVELLHVAIADVIRCFHERELYAEKEMWPTIEILLQLLTDSNDAQRARLALSVLLSAREWFRARLRAWAESFRALVESATAAKDSEAKKRIFEQLQTLKQLEGELKKCINRPDLEEDAVRSAFTLCVDLECRGRSDEASRGPVAFGLAAQFRETFTKMLASGESFTAKETKELNSFSSGDPVNSVWNPFRLFYTPRNAAANAGSRELQLKVLRIIDKSPCAESSQLETSGQIALLLEKSSGSPTTC